MHARWFCGAVSLFFLAALSSAAVAQEEDEDGFVLRGFGGRRSDPPTGPTRQLVDALFRFHVSLEDVRREDFLDRCYQEARRRLQVSPDGAETALIPLGGVEGWESLLRRVDAQGEAGEDPEAAEAQLEVRLRLLEASVLAALDDPFTMLMHSEEIFSFQALFESAFPAALGVDVEEADGLRLSFVIAGSDAFHKGLRRGDRLLAVDGTPAEELGLEAVKAAVQDAVTLRVQREGWERPADVPLAPGRPGGRAACMIDERVGYLAYRMFDGTSMQLKEAGRRLQRQGAKGLILDLRGNPGGLIADAWVLGSLFSDRGAVLSRLRIREEVPAKLPDTLVGTGPAFDLELPLAVLVNGSSASASELVSAGFQDQRRALIVGTTTFGKGIGQVPVPLLPALDSLLGDSSVFSLARQMDMLFVSCLWFDGPRGENIHGKGLSPDLRCPPAELGPAFLEARCRYFDDAAFVSALFKGGLAAPEVAALREDRAPARLIELAREAGLDPGTPEDLAALAHVARVVHQAAHPELSACPVVDPQLAKAVRAIEVQLR